MISHLKTVVIVLFFVCLFVWFVGGFDLFDKVASSLIQLQKHYRDDRQHNKLRVTPKHDYF